MSGFRWILARAEQLFLSGGSPAELGVHRILFYGSLLAYSCLTQQDLSRWSTVSDVFWGPTYFFSILHLPVAPAAVLLALTWLWRVSLFLSAIGLLTRASAWLAFPLGFYLLGLPQNFGKVHHGDAVAVIGLAIFACARSGDGWSLDNVLRAMAGRRRPSPTEGGEYAWPLRLFRLMLTLVLFAAAMAKMRDAGPLAWVASDNLYYTLLRHHYTHQPATDLGLWFARVPWLCRLIAGGALALEFAAPLLVVLPVRWRVPLLAAVLGMMLGFGLTLGVLFVEYVALLAIFFLPWPDMGRWIARTVPVGRLAVLYDGSCGLCRRTVAVIRALDVLERIDILDARGDWPRVTAHFPHLTQAACMETMHVAGEDGRVFIGFYAYRALARALPLGWPCLPWLHVPGVPAVGERVYAAVARRRHAKGCPLPPRGEGASGAGEHAEDAGLGPRPGRGR